MKKIRLFTKSFSLLLGAIGLSALFTSCHKERTCNCTQSSTYTYSGQSYTYSQSVTKTTEEKCWALNETTEYIDGGSSSTQTLTCD